MTEDEQKLILIIHNIRSAHNVGSLLRTADGLGVEKVYMTGITPYPLSAQDPRLPHIGRKVHRRIVKTALGAEGSVEWERADDIDRIIRIFKRKGFIIAALEQTADSIALPSFLTDKDVVLIIGNEVDGIDEDTLKLADVKLAIPMAGKKESFNVASAAAMALYHLTFKD